MYNLHTQHILQTSQTLRSPSEKPLQKLEYVSTRTFTTSIGQRALSVITSAEADQQVRSKTCNCFILRYNNTRVIFLAELTDTKFAPALTNISNQSRHTTSEETFFPLHFQENSISRRDALVLGWINRPPSYSTRRRATCHRA